MRGKPNKEALGVIWRVPDELWALIEPILLKDAPPKRTGRPRTDWRRAFDGVLFRMRSGCQWNRLPKEFGDDSSVHRWFQRWNRNGVMKRIWAILITQCEELRGVHWKWQSADGAMAKARFGGEKDWAESHGSGQARYKAKRADRREGRPAGGGHRRSQPA